MPPQKHTCLTAFWGQQQPFEALVLMLNNISTGGALEMSDATYYTLCALQREVERAVGDPALQIPGHGLGPSPWTPQDEALLRAAAQAFMAELVKDQYDDVPEKHASGTSNWLDSNQTAEDAPHSAVDAIRGGRNPPPLVVPDGILPRIRNALGS